MRSLLTRNDTIYRHVLSLFRLPNGISGLVLKAEKPRIRKHDSETGARTRSVVERYTTGVLSFQHEMRGHTSELNLTCNDDYGLLGRHFRSQF